MSSSKKQKKSALERKVKASILEFKDEMQNKVIPQIENTLRKRQEEADRIRKAGIPINSFYSQRSPKGTNSYGVLKKHEIAPLAESDVDTFYHDTGDGYLPK